MEQKMEVTTEFKQWCMENGHTARSVAEKTGLSLHTVHSYMQGQRYPSRKTLKAMEEAYGVSMRDLFPL